MFLAKRGTAKASCPSDLLSVTLRYRELEFCENNFTADQPNLFTLYRPNIRDLLQMEHPKF